MLLFPEIEGLFELSTPEGAYWLLAAEIPDSERFFPTLVTISTSKQGKGLMCDVTGCVRCQHTSASGCIVHVGGLNRQG